jgi:hypothetical protein
MGYSNMLKFQIKNLELPDFPHDTAVGGARN